MAQKGICMAPGGAQEAFSALPRVIRCGALSIAQNRSLGLALSFLRGGWLNSHSCAEVVRPRIDPQIA
jgi:hypothetical protein